MAVYLKLTGKNAFLPALRAGIRASEKARSKKCLIGERRLFSEAPTVPLKFTGKNGFLPVFRVVISSVRKGLPYRQELGSSLMLRNSLRTDNSPHLPHNSLFLQGPETILARQLPLNTVTVHLRPVISSLHKAPHILCTTSIPVPPNHRRAQRLCRSLTFLTRASRTDNNSFLYRPQ